MEATLPIYSVFEFTNLLLQVLPAHLNNTEDDMKDQCICHFEDFNKVATGKTNQGMYPCSIA
jgi:hypothetical protein